MSDKSPSRRTLLSLAALMGWLVCCALGWWAYTRYEYSPGELAQAPGRWPSASGVQRTTGRPQLVVFVHPRCGCTRATLASVAEVVEGADAAVDVHVLFFRPGAESADWARTDLWQMAGEIGGADVREDVDGVEARDFGARTSGQVLFYDADGVLQLATGVTPSRGHVGKNDGLASLAKLVSGQPSATRESDVFGCPLSNENRVVSRMGSDR